ncbi:hypothetical protein [Nonlabens sp.]|uniref:hypothetical protein n=1 Tax=Nonlabens sp. TaxID=1888209 RepID=UPI0025F85366|nr:hypothetical protein [Nonlabens sp.]
MKKLVVVILMLAVYLSLFSCTPESFTDPIEGVQACCKNEGGVETPPPPLPPPSDNNGN